MDELTITLGDTKYEYINSINYQNKNYVALWDGECITINEYTIIHNKLLLTPINDDLFSEIKGRMHL